MHMIDWTPAALRLSAARPGGLGVGVDPGVPDLVHSREVARDVLHPDAPLEDVRLARTGFRKKLVDLVPVENVSHDR